MQVLRWRSFWTAPKMFIRLRTWIVDKNSMKRHSQIRKNFTANWPGKTLQNTKPRRVSWFIRANWYTIIVGFIWKFKEQMERNTRIELLTDVDLLLMVENGIRGGMFHAIDQYAKENNKYMKDYDTSKKPSYLMYGNINNSYRRAMSQKLTAGGFKWRKILFRFDEELMQNYNLDRAKDTSCKLMLIILMNYSMHTMIYHFHPKKRGLISLKNLYIIWMATWKIVIHIGALKQALDYGKIQDKLHRAIEFNKEEWLKPYIDRYLTDDVHGDKKAKGTKICVIKQEIKFQDYKECLEENKTLLKSQQRFRVETNNLFTVKVSKIALSANDDKRI